MAIVKSGTTSDLWTIDSSKAGRTAPYDSAANSRGHKQTFAGSVFGVGVPGGVPAFYIAGVANKLVVFQRLRITGPAATGVFGPSPSLTKYRTAFSGGTLTYLTTAPFDSQAGLQPLATPATYTAAPTLGVVSGPIGAATVIAQSSAASAGAGLATIEWDFRAIAEGGGIYLRGPNDGIATTLNTGGNAITAVVETQWTEI